MTAPFRGMRVSGIVWYQGEAMKWRGGGGGVA
jgi:hypothetical protein